MPIKQPSNLAAMQPTSTAAPVAKKSKNVIDYLNGDSFKNQLSMALPKFLDTDHFVRSAISDFRLNPALQECSVPSVLGFYMQAAMTGLEPASSLGQCYPVPFNNKKTGQKEVQFIMGYKGMISLARRSGEIQSIDAKVVHEADEFTLRYGLNPALDHVPCLRGNAGNILGAYAVVRFKDGSYQFDFMTKSDIDKIRNRSRAYGRSPWDTDYEEMAKKTVVRRLFKLLPISIEQATAAATDGVVARLKPEAATAESVEDMLETDFVASVDNDVEPTEDEPVEKSLDGYKLDEDELKSL